jgi:1-acyl-sn-glycerol-3-phosphate acyltransferase
LTSDVSKTAIVSATSDIASAIVVATVVPKTPAPRWTMKAVGKVALIAAAAAPLLPAQMATHRFAPRVAHVIPRLFHRVVCRALGVRVRVSGVAPDRSARTLIVANHVSWLDVSVIGATGPLSFVAKSEIAGWPGIGLLARLQRSIFLDRTRRTATAAATSAMADRLGRGESIVLFAEGTTGDGTRILPFRSSLLGAVKEALGPQDDGEIIVQPLAILYLGRHGLPGGRAERALLAWYGDTELGPHLADMLNGGPIDVELVWGEPIRMGRGHSRKETARLAEEAVRRAAISRFTGRAPADGPAPAAGAVRSGSAAKADPAIEPGSAAS